MATRSKIFGRRRYSLKEQSERIRERIKERKTKITQARLDLIKARKQKKAITPIQAEIEHHNQQIETLSRKHSEIKKKITK